MMKIDIEKLNKKMPYPEPEKDFFERMQNKVVANAFGEETIKEKETKVISLNIKWFAAAAVVLIAGLTTFFTLEKDKEIVIAKNINVVDSVYNLKNELDNFSSGEKKSAIEENKILADVKKEAEIINPEQKIVSNKKSANFIKAKSLIKPDKKYSESEVDKVLVAFTPDQLNEIEKNSEQDIYLDLYY